MSGLTECEILDAGMLDYPEAYVLQKRILNRVICGQASHTLISCQHPHVITLSRRTGRESILAGLEELEKCGVGIYCADRGGDATYHGPGQIILYPIFDLRRDKKDLHLFLRKLEEVVIRALICNFGLNAHRRAGFTGVWVGPYKVASIGIGVRHWVTYHGLALNIRADKRFFSLIRPCGLDVKMASVSDFFTDDITVESVREMLLKSFSEVFEVKIRRGV